MKQETKPNSFIAKFHSILKNKTFQSIIKFDEPKSKIYILDKEKLQLQILPYFFRHNKFTSFIRQLNLYGFKKIKNTNCLSFTHPSLINGQKFTTIVAKKKSRNEQLQQDQANSVIQNSQQINQELHYNISRLERKSLPLISNQITTAPIVNALSYPLLGETMMMAPNGGFQGGWGLAPNGVMTYFMPMPQILPESVFINYYMQNQ